MARRHHALAVPLPAQGHINPMMRFCRKLAREGVIITFVNVDVVHYRLQGLKRQQQQQQDDTAGDDMLLPPPDGSGDKLDIRRAHVPIEGLDLSKGFAVSSEEFFEAQKSITPHLRRLLLHLNRSGPPVTCIISDICMTAPTQPLADSFNLPWIALYPSSQSILLLYHYFRAGPLSIEGVSETVSDMSKSRSEVFAMGLEGLPSNIEKKDLPHFRHVLDDTAYMLKFLDSELDQCLKHAHSIVVNSFDELEGAAFEMLSARVKVPIYGIGPLVEPLKEDNITSLWKEDEACMLWLEQQPPLSVLYISFGSATLLSHPQFEEILHGLLSSAQRFLWVFRPGLVQNSPSPSPSPSSIEPPPPPLDLISKAQGRGFCVGWAPQLQVLSHPSIGGFLTHCGWNSTIEAISLGVPMLCWPYLADQFFNAKYVTEEWKIGLSFEMDDDCGMVVKNEIQKVITTLMEGEEGKVLRENAKQLQKACSSTILPGGESYSNTQNFLLSLTRTLLFDMQ